MPYFIHPKDVDPTTFPPIATDDFLDRGYVAHTSRQSAFEALTSADQRSTHTITFVPSADERRDWHDREKGRLRNGEYLPVPWYEPATLRHVAHLSTDKTGMIAYTPDDEHGVRDKQVRLTPGRYLERFREDLGIEHASIAAYVAEVQATAAAELKIATSIDDVRAIYRNGPSSCMGGPVLHTSQYWTESSLDGHMPCEVYAESPDLAVAYIGTPDKPSQRAIVWPEEKTYVRVYGTGPLETLLKASGYSETDSLSGARVRLIRVRRGILMPYVDGCESADICSGGNRYLSLCEGDDGQYGCHTTSGVADEPHQCAHCGDSDADNQDGDDWYCSSCWDNRWTCEDCSESGFNSDDSYYISRTSETLCYDCYRARHVTCADEHCDRTFYEEDEFSMRESSRRAAHDLSDLCRTCADRYVYCETCEHAYDPTCDGPTCPTCDRSGRCPETGDLLATAASSVPASDVSATTTLYRLEVRSLDQASGSFPVWSPCFFDGGDEAAGSNFGALSDRGTNLFHRHGTESEYRIVTATGRVLAYWRCGDSDCVTAELRDRACFVFYAGAYVVIRERSDAHVSPF